jgi:hypothetical protein
MNKREIKKENKFWHSNTSSEMNDSISTIKEIERLEKIEQARAKYKRLPIKKKAQSIASPLDVIGSNDIKLNPYKASLETVIDSCPKSILRKSNLTGKVIGKVKGYNYETGRF